MAPLTAGRNTPARSAERRNFPLEAATTIFAGSMVALNGTGNLVPVTETTGLKIVGRAESDVDNSAGAAGDLTCEVSAGVFRFNNFSGDLVTRIRINNDCYGVDDQTVGRGDNVGARSIAGKIFDVDADGVWVQF